METFSSWTALLMCAWASSFGVTISQYAECPPTNYGVDCLKNCSATCLDQRCDHVTGECDACPPDKIGRLCHEDCPLGFYGTDCLLECKECAGDRTCHSPHGACSHGCKDGYQGDACDRPCGFKNYGPGCMSNCSQFCKVDLNKAQAVCYHATGVCLMGCQDGYQGPKCDVQSQSQKPEKSSSPGLSIGIGVTIGLMAVIIIVVIISVYCYNKRVRQPLPNEDVVQQDNENSKVPSSPLSDGPPSPQYDELSSPRSPGLPSPGYEQLSCFRYEKPPSFLFEGQYSIKNKAKGRSQDEENSDLQQSEGQETSEKEQKSELRQDGDQISQTEESSKNNEQTQKSVDEVSPECHQDEIKDPESGETASSPDDGPQNHPNKQVTHSLEESPSRSQEETTPDSQIIQIGESPPNKLAQSRDTNQEGQSKDQDVVIDCQDDITDEHGNNGEQKDQDKSPNRKQHIYQDKPETFVTYL